MEILRTQLKQLSFFRSQPRPIRPGEREKQKITKYTVLTIIVCIMYLSPHALAFAGASEELMPGSEISSPFYQRYDMDAYMLDYVPPVDMDTFDIEGRFYWAIALLINLLWIMYVYLAEFCIRMVNWVYDTTLTNDMIRLLEQIMPDLWSVVWEEFWWVTASIGILGIVLIFTLGRSLEAVQKMLAMILILALAPLLPELFPATAVGLNDSVTIAGGAVLEKLITTEAEKEEIEVPRDPVQELEAFRNIQGQIVITPDLQRKVEVIKGVHAVDDSLIKGMIYKPWLIANYGSIETGEKYAHEHLMKGDDKEARRKYLREVGEIKDDGTTEKEEFKIFTEDGIEDRILNTWGAMLFPGAVILFLIGFAVVILIWTARGIGRACMLVFYALFSLWPGYGLGEFARSIFSTVQAFLMKLFYTVALGVMLAIWNVFQDPEAFPDLHLVSRVIILFILIAALWAEVKRVYQKFKNPRGLNGQSMGDDSSDPMETMENTASRTMRAGTRQVMMNRSMKRMGMGPGRGNLSTPENRIAGSVRNFRQNYPEMKRRMSRAFSPKQAQVRANLSNDARELYTRMVNRKKNPMTMWDRHEWAASNPADAHLIKEIDQWSKQSTERMGAGQFDDDMIPAPAPLRNTPEFAIFQRDPEWQQRHKLWTEAREEVHQKAWEDYRGKMQQFEKKGFFGTLRRTLLREPELVEPSDIEVMRRFQKKMDAIKKDQDD